MASDRIRRTGAAEQRISPRVTVPVRSTSRKPSADSRDAKCASLNRTASTPAKVARAEANGTGLSPLDSMFVHVR